MSRRLAAIAQVAWRDLAHSRALWAFVAGGLLAGVVPVATLAGLGQGGGALAEAGASALGAASALATSALVWLGAGSVDREVRARTLAAVFARPVATWTYLLGRAIAHVGLFGLFVGLAAGASWAMLARHGSMPATTLAWTCIDACGRATMWTCVAVSLGALVGGARARALFSAVWLWDELAGRLAGPAHPLVEAVARLMWALGPVRGPPTWGRLAALSGLENLLWGGAVLGLCSLALARRDVPLRD